MVLQDKQWRQQQSWYKNGKSNECEIYQKSILGNVISCKLTQTHERIHIRSLRIVYNKYPMRNDNGYEYTEDFDGKECFNQNTLYYNLKMVCDRGGAQTRTLREVYHFVYYQLEYLLKSKTTTFYSCNIIDGDEFVRNKRKFKYLLSSPRYKHVRKYVFCGTMKSFLLWYPYILKKIRSS